MGSRAWCCRRCGEAPIPGIVTVFGVLVVVFGFLVVAAGFVAIALLVLHWAAASTN